MLRLENYMWSVHGNVVFGLHLVAREEVLLKVSGFASAPNVQVHLGKQM